MKITQFCTTVTPFSKSLAAILFILSPFAGFYLGWQYQKELAVPDIKIIEKIVKVKEQVPALERNLMEICGDFPALNISSDGHFTRVTGPSWSPDCRHIAYAAWQSTFKNSSINVGLFVYDYATKKTKKVYNPKQGDNEEDIEFLSWKNNTTILYANSGPRNLYTLDLLTGKSQKETQ